jgi:hypothetical protein
VFISSPRITIKPGSSQLQVSSRRLLALRGAVTSTVVLLLLVCVAVPRALADEPSCFVSIGGAETGQVRSFHDGPGEQLLVSAANGLFRYDGKRIIPVEGGEKTGFVTVFHDGPGEQLLVGADGLFRYDGKSVVLVEGGEKTGSVTVFHDGPGGLLLGAENGPFRVIFESISKTQIELTNWSKLQEPTLPPFQVGILTTWTMKHPCSAIADRFGLNVVATNASRKDDIPVEVKHFDPVVRWHQILRGRSPDFRSWRLDFLRGVQGNWSHGRYRQTFRTGYVCQAWRHWMARLVAASHC